MKKVFVDTGAWIALAERSDVHHLQANAITDKLSRDNTLLITSDYVLDETITWFRYNVSHKVAKQVFSFDTHFITAGFELVSQI